jgi:hypothetical protein
MVEVEEIAPDVGPEKASSITPAGRPIEPCMTGDLRHPGEIGEVAARMHALAVLAAEISDGGRQWSLPRPVVVSVRPRSGSSTGTDVSSAKILGDDRIVPTTNSATGRSQQQARPTRFARVEPSRSMPSRATICARR